MDENQNFFRQNFKYMLDCLHTNPHELSEKYKDFQCGPNPRDPNPRFKFRKDGTFPSRASLHEYIKEGGSQPRGKSLRAIVQFFNDNLQRNVSEKEFLSQPLGDIRRPAELKGLVGEYYGLFLNPNTKRGEREKRFCGAVLRIWNSGTEQAPVFRAQMAAEIREENLLFDRRIPEVFRQEDPSQAFVAFRKELPGGQQSRFAYFEGGVSLVDEVVVCALEGKTMPKVWTIHLDFGRMLKYLRGLPEGEKHTAFRGGMGGAVVSNDRDYGTYFMKFALLSTRFREQLRMNDPGILNCLGLGRNPGGVIKIDGDMDREWYDFMNNKFDRNSGKIR